MCVLAPGECPNHSASEFCSYPSSSWPTEYLISPYRAKRLQQRRDWEKQSKNTLEKNNKDSDLSRQWSYLNLTNSPIYKGTILTSLRHRLKGAGRMMEGQDGMRGHPILTAEKSFSFSKHAQVANLGNSLTNSPYV